MRRDDDEWIIRKIIDRDVVKPWAHLKPRVAKSLLHTLCIACVIVD